MNVESWLKKQRQFIKERDWEQFHNPKNLAMALSVEASELVEIFQWLTPEQAQNLKNKPEQKESVADELCDIFFYTIRLLDQMDIDFEEALERKFQKNALKYPVEKAKGLAKKYNQLD